MDILSVGVGAKELASEVSGLLFPSTNRVGGRKARPESGGVALEYILVGTVAIFVSIALLKFSLGVFTEKIKDLGEETGIDFSSLHISPFSDSAP